MNNLTTLCWFHHPSGGAPGSVGWPIRSPASNMRFAVSQRRVWRPMGQVIGDTVQMPEEAGRLRPGVLRRASSGGLLRLRDRQRRPEVPAHVLYRDERDIAFLPNLHVLLGYVLLAPIEHREAVVGDFSIDEYLALQGVVLSRSSGRHRDGPQGKGHVGRSSPRSSCRRQRDR